MEALADPPPDPSVQAAWRLRLLGDIVLEDGRQRIDRLPSRAVAALLARLALAPDRLHTREELVELLWPGVEAAVARNRLRQVLSTLKSLLVSPLCAQALRADRQGVRLVDGALSCDVLAFESALRQGDLLVARRLWRGDLMPGHYDDWVLEERARLTTLAQRYGLGAPAGGAPAPRPARWLEAMPAPVRHALPPVALPVYATRAIGLHAQAEQLMEALLQQRLVTLIGPGGHGKTRLAVEAASRLAEPGDPGRRRFDVVAFVPLLGCRDGAQMLAALAATLRLGRTDADLLERLTDALAGLAALLVLDNFEQLDDAAAVAVAELLARLPRLHLLVTSRRALGIAGECRFAIRPLAVPADDSADAVAASPAVALLVERARAVRADFHLGDRNRAAVAALVRRLQGLPLAIELAAARLHSLPPAQVLALLDGQPGARLDLLSRGGPRTDRDPRHGSMRHTVGWSWDLLPAPLQALLADVAVLEAPFGIDLALALHADVPMAPVAMACALQELASHSLLVALSPADGTACFVVYEPVRDVAEERRDGARSALLRARLRRWLTRRTTADSASGDTAAAEEAGVHVGLALRSAIADADVPQAARLALALRRRWLRRGADPAALTDLETLADALAAPALPEPAGRRAGAPADDAADAAVVDRLRSGLHELLARLQVRAGQVERAGQHVQAALATAAGDPASRGPALVTGAWLSRVRVTDDVSTDAQLAHAIELAEACGDLETQARAWHQRAALLRARGEHQACEQLMQRAQELWARLGDAVEVTARLHNRAQCWAALGRVDDALAVYEHCIAQARARGDAVLLIDATLSRGTLLLDHCRWQEGLRAIVHCAQASWAHHELHGLAYALWNLGRPLAHLRQATAGAYLMSFAETFWTQRFGALTAADQRYIRRVRRLAGVQIGDAALALCWAEGRQMSLPQAMAMAFEAAASAGAPPPPG